MFLSDTEIKKEIERGNISIRPMLDLDSQLCSCSLDLRMGQIFMFFRRSAIPYIDPLSYQKKEAFDTKRFSIGEKVIIHPGMDVLTTTLEEIKLPLNIVGFISARSSLIRLGLDISPAFGRIDPGFQGKIVMRLHNFCGVPIAVVPGMRVCSLAFARILGEVEKGYNGKYQKAESYEPKIYQDKDVQLLRFFSNSDMDRLLQEKITPPTLMQMSLQRLSSKLGETHKKIVLQILKLGPITTPKLANQLHYNKYYLSSVMKELVENAIVKRSIVRGRGGGFYYDLTDVGKALAEYLEKENQKMNTHQFCQKPQINENTALMADIYIREVHLIPRDNSSPRKLHDEYVVLENRGKNSINMTGWKMINLVPRGAKPYSYTFPSKLADGSSWQLEPGQSLRVITGRGSDHLTAKGELVFFWNREWFAWWPGDTVLLVDEKDNEITRFRIL
jgi:dCTP deaminase